MFAKSALIEYAMGDELAFLSMLVNHFQKSIGCNIVPYCWDCLHATCSQSRWLARFFLRHMFAVTYVQGTD